MSTEVSFAIFSVHSGWSVYHVNRMARLHEYQGKALLKEHGIAVPEGEVVTSAGEARRVANRLGGTVVLKAQAWVTGRAEKGGIQFAETPDEACAVAEEMFDRTFGNFPVDQILIERALEIEHEIFVSLTIDDAAGAPVLLLNCAGGSGIENRAADVAQIAVKLPSPFGRRAGGEGDRSQGILFDERTLRETLIKSPIDVVDHDEIVSTILAIIRIAKNVEARSLEVNPLVITVDGTPARIVAADCRVTIDDYAVFRHPELGIEIARELDHPPTELEKLAYAIEEADHRGTFYFAQLEQGSGRWAMGDGKRRGSNREVSSIAHSPLPIAPLLIGFHGAGGGGSMMSMDAVTSAGFTLANFCDTSGNPSAAKVYRAARIILCQPGLVGYFGSGSGVASQEQFWSAYGLAKAFNEVNLSIPAVIRLGGNSEDRAVEILEDACRDLPATVEGYKKDDTPQFCADRFAQLVAQHAAPHGRKAGGEEEHDLGRRHIPDFVGAENAYSFAIDGGRVWIDHVSCDGETTTLVIQHSFGLLKRDDRGKPVLGVDPEEVRSKDSELIACEMECLRAGRWVVFVDLAISGLDAEEVTIP